MPWTQSTITSVEPPIVQGRMVFLSWTTSATPGSVYFQVYLDGALSWYGLTTNCYVPIPTGTLRIDIGSVLPGEQTTDFSSSLPTAPARRAEISWLGGTFESPDLAGFYVYGQAIPGGPIDYTKALATITAYPGGILVGAGWGETTWGDGPWGDAVGIYSWTSDSLVSGVYSFAVKAFDSAGNLGTAQTVSVTIAVPPLEPALMPDGLTRLAYTLAGAPTPEVTLTWLPSPA